MDKIAPTMDIFPKELKTVETPKKKKSAKTPTMDSKLSKVESVFSVFVKKNRGAWEKSVLNLRHFINGFQLSQQK